MPKCPPTKPKPDHTLSLLKTFHYLDKETDMVSAICSHDMDVGVTEGRQHRAGPALGDGQCGPVQWGHCFVYIQTSS